MTERVNFTRVKLILLEILEILRSGVKYRDFNVPKLARNKQALRKTSTKCPIASRLIFRKMFGRGITSALLVLALVLTFSGRCSATHLTGRFNPGREFFKFLIKFGFQKTERSSSRDTYGYMYGNITATGPMPVNLTFAVLDGNRFLNYYGNHSIPNREIACQKMFAELNSLSYSSECNSEAKGDYLRQVPCPVGELCPDEDNPLNVVHGNQFTYVISNLFQPR